MTARQPLPYAWRYIHGSPLAHLVDVDNQIAKALCGLNPLDYGQWCGNNTKTQRALLHQKLVCRACATKLNMLERDPGEEPVSPHATFQPPQSTVWTGS